MPQNGAVKLDNSAEEGHQRSGGRRGTTATTVCLRRCFAEGEGLRRKEVKIWRSGGFIWRASCHNMISRSFRNAWGAHKRMQSGIPPSTGKAATGKHESASFPTAGHSARIQWGDEGKRDAGRGRAGQ